MVVTSIQASGSALENTVAYEVTYRINDPSGVDRVAFYKKDTRQATVTFAGGDATGLVSSAFAFTGYETLLVDGVLGPSVKMRAVDGYGTADNVTRRGQNSFSRLAELIGTAELPGLDDLLEEAPPELQAVFEGVDQAAKAYPVFLMAILSGVSYSAGVAIKDFVRLLTEFWTVAKELVQMVAIFATNPGLVLKIPEMMTKAAARAQEIQNPFPGTELPSLDDFSLDVRHTVFAAGWYIGGVVGMVGAELLLSLGVGAAAKGLAAIATKLGALLRTTRAAQLLMRSSRLVSASKWLVNAVTTGIKGLRYLDPGVLLAKAAGLTRGMAVRVIRQIDELSGPTKRALPDGGEDLLVSYLQRTDDAGRRVLDELPDSLSRRLVSVGDTPDGGQFQRFITRAVDQGELSFDEADKLVKQYDRLDAGQREAFLEAVERAGDDALGGAAGLSQRRLETVLDADVSASRKASALRGVKRVGSDNLGETPGGRDLAIRYLFRNGDEDLDLFKRAEVCNSPCDKLQDDVYQFVDDVDGLDLEHGEDLLTTYKFYDEAEGKDIRDVEDIQGDLNRLAEEDVDGIDRAVRERTVSRPFDRDIDSAVDNFKGLDGEAETATRLLDAGYDADEITLEKDVSTSRGSTDVDAEVLAGDDIAIQVKAIDYRSSAGIPELDKKDIKRVPEIYSQKGYDEVVLATNTDDAGNIKAFKEMAEDLESSYNVDVRFIRIDRVNEL